MVWELNLPGSRAMSAPGPSVKARRGAADAWLKTWARDMARYAKGHEAFSWRRVICKDVTHFLG